MQKTVRNSRRHHRRIETESGDAAAGKARKTDERVQNLDPNESRRAAAGSGPARRSEVGRPAGPTAKRLLQTKRDIASLKSVHLPGTQRARSHVAPAPRNGEPRGPGGRKRKGRTRSRSRGVSTPPTLATASATQTQRGRGRDTAPRPASGLPDTSRGRRGFPSVQGTAQGSATSDVLLNTEIIRNALPDLTVPDA